MDQEKIKIFFRYNSSTGVFTDDSGCLVGHKCRSGYIKMTIEGSVYSAHRIAWVYMFGDIPKGMLIDHKNGDKSDNRISNLRLATKSQNQYNRKTNKNSKTRLKGVYFDKANGKYKAQIQINSIRKHIGYFEDPCDAHSAYMEYAKKHHGEYFRG